MHKCPHPDCTEYLPQHILGCLKHWRSLPRDIRDEVNATWRSGDMKAYLPARERAVAWWEADAAKKAEAKSEKQGALKL